MIEYKFYVYELCTDVNNSLLYYYIIIYSTSVYTLGNVTILLLGYKNKQI